MTTLDDLAEIVDRHYENMRRLRRQLLIRIPVAIILGCAIGYVLRFLLWLLR